VLKTTGRQGLSLFEQAGERRLKLEACNDRHATQLTHASAVESRCMMHKYLEFEENMLCKMRPSLKGIMMEGIVTLPHCSSYSLHTNN
jgi:hypothetical protein